MRKKILIKVKYKNIKIIIIVKVNNNIKEEFWDIPLSDIENG